MPDEKDTYPFWIESTPEGHTRLGLSETYLETIAEELVGLELSPALTLLMRGDTLGFIHTSRRTLDLRVPFDLEVMATNPAALDDPGLVRRAPYGRGWLVEVRLVASES